MANFSRTHHRLRYVTIAAAVLNAIYLLIFGTSWAWIFSLPAKSMLGQITGMLFFAACLCIPYVVFIRLLHALAKSSVMQVLSFSLVMGVSAYFYISIRFSNQNSGGWEYVLVPFAQLILIFISYAAEKLRAQFFD
jgi:hypothetical protein